MLTPKLYTCYRSCCVCLVNDQLLYKTLLLLNTHEQDEYFEGAQVSVYIYGYPILFGAQTLLERQLVLREHVHQGKPLRIANVEAAGLSAVAAVIKDVVDKPSMVVVVVAVFGSRQVVSLVAVVFLSFFVVA